MYNYQLLVLYINQPSIDYNKCHVSCFMYINKLNKSFLPRITES